LDQPLESAPKVGQSSSPPQASTSTKKPAKRKSVAPDIRPPPAKKPRRPLPPPSVSSESEDEILSSNQSASPEPEPTTNRRRKRQPEEAEGERTEPGTVELRVHKVSPTSGGTKQVNEIDGFLQVVTEVLTLTAERVLKQDATQAKILDAFTEEVTIRLIEMTDAWDSHAVLTGAVRKAQKRKNTLRQELLAIRKERALTQREMEEIRQAHELGEQELKDLNSQKDFIADVEDIKGRLDFGQEEDDIVEVFTVLDLK
jgi:hypothetical protein